MMPLSKWLVVGKRGAQPRGGTRPSEDTLRRLLPFLVEHVGPEVVLLLSQACKPWRHELETRGFCSRTCQLLLTLASVNRPQLGHEDEDPDEEEDEAPEVRVLFARLGHNALQRLAANPSSWMVSANSFLQRRWDWRGSLHEWLQFASQEPTGSFARCAASTAEALSLKLVLWVNKPQWSYPGIATLAGHSGEVTSVAYNADGTRIVSGSWDMTVKIWDVATGATMHTLGHTCTGRCRCAMKHVVDYEGKRKLVKHRQCPLKGHSGEVHCVAFSPDGKRVVSASNDFRVKIWNVETGAEVCTLTGHTGQVYSVAFSPDGKLVVSGSGDKLVKIWNTETGAEVLTLGGQQVRTLTGQLNAVYAVAFSPDSKRVVSGFQDGTVKIWDVETGAEVRTFMASEIDAPISSLAFSPDGTRIVSGGEDSHVKIWDTKTGAEIFILRGHSEQVKSVAWSPEGKLIVSGSDDHLVKIWNTETGAEVCTLSFHSCGVSSVGFSPDGKRVVSGSEELVKVWDVEAVTQVCKPQGHSGDVNSVGFSPDGKLAATGSDDHLVKIWNTETGQEVHTLGHSCTGSCICSWGKDEHRDSTFVVHKECPVSGHSSSVTRVQFSDDGTQVISGSGSDDDNQEVRVWDVASGKEVRQAAAAEFPIIAGATAHWPDRYATQHKTAKHFLTESGDTLLITKQRPCSASAWRTIVEDIEGGACFMAPDEIVAQRSHGAAICVGCARGAVCFLHAPFVAV